MKHFLGQSANIKKYSGNLDTDFLLGLLSSLGLNPIDIQPYMRNFDQGNFSNFNDEFQPNGVNAAEPINYIFVGYITGGIICDVNLNDNAKVQYGMYQDNRDKSSGVLISNTIYQNNLAPITQINSQNFSPHVAACAWIDISVNNLNKGYIGLIGYKIKIY